jgi:site-specific recombinase XerC
VSSLAASVERYFEFAIRVLAALRHLFDWMVIGQIMPTNPAAAVRGPRHIVRRGKTPALGFLICAVKNSKKR